MADGHGHNDGHAGLTADIGFNQTASAVVKATWSGCRHESRSEKWEFATDSNLSTG